MAQYNVNSTCVHISREDELSINISHQILKLLDIKNICICGSTPHLRTVLYRIIKESD